MKPADEKIIIIGTGLAGYMFAKELRKYDTATPLLFITRSDGYFYSKPLLSTALTHHKTADALCVSNAQTMCQQLNADILTRCDVYQIDAHHKTVLYRDENNHEHRQSYAKLILAIGANPIEIVLKGDGVGDVLHVNQLEDYRVFREQLMNKKHVAIFGAGLAGCEFANDLVNANYRVTMIAPEVYPLSSLIPEAVGFALQDAFSKAGIDFHLTVFPQTVNHADNGYEITLSNGATVHADMIFSAVGIRPNTTLAQTAHLSINRGVMVSTYLQTNDPDIYALGDCAEVDGQLKMHIAAILHQARLLAEVVAGETPPIQHQITPIVIKTPLCPIVVEPPPTQLQGEWQVSGDGVNVKALFYDVDHHLRGFALAGSCVNERMSLVKALSA